MPVSDAYIFALKVQTMLASRGVYAVLNSDADCTSFILSVTARWCGDDKALADVPVQSVLIVTDLKDEAVSLSGLVHSTLGKEFNDDEAEEFIQKYSEDGFEYFVDDCSPDESPFYKCLSAEFKGIDNDPGQDIMCADMMMSSIWKYCHDMERYLG